MSHEPISNIASSAAESDDESHLTITPRHVRNAFDVARTFLTAMILAFIFRAFLIEAFIIPTGSMASGLLGAHRTVVCADCGTQFDVSAPDSPQQTQSDTIHVRCPNCLASDERDEATAHWRAGDRILVHKWIYDFGAFLSPKRWDVIVFRDPADATQNYIKRVAALPNESVEIVAGDVYINGLIARKPVALQRHLWIPVFHQDLPPSDQSPFFTGPVWSEAPDEHRTPAWTGLTTRVIRHAPVNDDSDVLEFARSASPTYEQDFMAYNGQASGAYTRDFRVAFELLPIEGGGRVSIQIELPESLHEFIVESSGRVELRSKADDGDQIRQESHFGEFSAARKGRPIVVEFATVDDAQYGWIDGSLMTSTMNRAARDVIRARELRTDVPTQIRLTASGWTFDLRCLRVDRDIYYTRRPGTSIRAYAGEPFQLGPDEYFVLGDNSAASHDGREWRTAGAHLSEGYRLGTVPRSEIVGRAFFVYLPGLMPIDTSGRWRVPDFGSIRFVR